MANLAILLLYWYIFGPLQRTCCKNAKCDNKIINNFQNQCDNVAHGNPASRGLNLALHFKNFNVWHILLQAVNLHWSKITIMYTIHLYVFAS